MILGALVFLFPAIGLVIHHGASAVFGVLILVSAAAVFVYPADRPLQKKEKQMLAAFLLFFTWVVIVWFMGEHDYESFKRVKQYFRLIVFIPVYLLIRRVRPDSRYYWYGLMAGCFSAGAYAVMQSIFGIDNAYWGRAGGVVHPILFGGFALSMAVMLIPFFVVRRSRVARVLTVTAIVAGVLASLLSESRGGWLAIPVFAVMLLLAYRPRVSMKQLIAGVAAVMLVGMVIVSIPQVTVQKRIDQAVADVEHYRQGNLSNNSVGLRFEMWRAAGMMLAKHPVAGVGVDQYYTELKTLVHEGRISSETLAHAHPHNIFMLELATKGVIGGVVLLILLFMPVKLFYGFVGSSDAETRAFAVAGWLFATGWIIYGMSESMFHRVLPISYYAFFIMVTFACMYNRVDNADMRSVGG